MKEKVSFSVFIIVGLLTMPVFADELQWNGKWADPAKIRQFESQSLVPVEGSETPQAMPSWGTDSWSSTNVGACDACPRDGILEFSVNGCFSIEPTNANTSASIGFPLDLPHGAEIQYIYIYYYDDHSTSNPSMGLWSSDKTGTTTLIQGLSPSAFDGGNNSYIAGPFSHTVNNWENSYSILSILNRDASSTQKIYRIIVYYKLVVSPAPATASFTDVPTGHSFFQYIEALYDAGITSGCGAGKYCPDDPLTRGQMAVYLSRALGLHYPADEDP
jgi:hypothetical protein